jgi:transportin-3
MVLSYRTAILPLLPALADQLAIGFEKSHSGGFLWTTDAVLREFSDAELVDSATSQAIYRFFEQQAVAFLRIMNNVQPVDFADVIEDFFRLLDDTLIYYNREFVPSPLCSPILQAAIAVLVLQQHAPLSATLHYLYDFISYGSERPSSSSLDDAPKPIEIQPIVKRHILAQGENLVRGLLTGMMYSFPRDCLQDATAILIAMFEILPDQTGLWVKNTIAMMPPGTLKQGEAERVMANMATRVQQGDFRKLRSILQGKSNAKVLFKG